MKEKVNPVIAGVAAVVIIVLLGVVYRFTLYTPPPTSGIAAPAGMQAQLNKPQSAQKGSGALMDMMSARPPVSAMQGPGSGTPNDPNLAHLSPEQRRNSNQTPAMAGVPGAGAR